MEPISPDGRTFLTSIRPGKDSFTSLREATNRIAQHGVCRQAQSMARKAPELLKAELPTTISFCNSRPWQTVIPTKKTTILRYMFATKQEQSGLDIHWALEPMLEK